MDMRGRLTTPSAVQRYATAGNAAITVLSLKTGVRFTFRIKKSKPTPQWPKPIFFVSLMTGPDNINSFTYMGSMLCDEQGNARLDTFKVKFRGPITNDAPSVKAFMFVLAQCRAAMLNANLEIWHEGTCGCCNRALTVPESIAAGIGPVCASKGH